MRFALAVGMACFMNVQAVAWAQDLSSQQAPVEPKLETVIEHFFPGYFPVPLGELTPEIGALTVSDPVYDTPDRSPTMIKADFDGNGFADYALLISKLQEPEPDEIFVILMGHGEGRYSKAIESFFGGVARDIYLGFLPAGTVLAAPADVAGYAPALTLEQAAVTLSVYGQLSDAFYWDKVSGRFLSSPAPVPR